MVIRRRFVLGLDAPAVGVHLPAEPDPEPLPDPSDPSDASPPPAGTVMSGGLRPAAAGALTGRIGSDRPSGETMSDKYRFGSRPLSAFRPLSASTPFRLRPLSAFEDEPAVCKIVEHVTPLRGGSHTH